MKFQRHLLGSEATAQKPRKIEIFKNADFFDHIIAVAIWPIFRGGPKISTYPYPWWIFLAQLKKWPKCNGNYMVEKVMHFSHAGFFWTAIIWWRFWDLKKIFFDPANIWRGKKVLFSTVIIWWKQGDISLFLDYFVQK